MNDRLKEHQATAEDALEWLLENNTGAIAEFEEAGLVEEEGYNWVIGRESSTRDDPEHKV